LPAYGAKTLVTACSALPVIERPLSGALVVEAEDFAEESGGSVKIRTDKVGVSGRAFSHWVNKGHRLAWQTNVSQAGRYHLVLRYSCDKDAARSLRMDGKPLPGAEFVRFPATGGYGSSADEWSNVPVRLSNGEPAVWDLSAGPHKIAMESEDGSGVNLDQLALMPPRGPEAQKPSRSAPVP
jgi:hypothetical protein